MSGTVSFTGEEDLVNFSGMGRPKRAADGGVICHVLNRGNARMTIFEKEGDYKAFEHTTSSGTLQLQARWANGVQSCWGSGQLLCSR